MKFMLFVLPTVPGTLEDRKRLRPIGRNNERYQQMLEELRKLAVLADDAGFDVMATTEHHFHSEGYETSVAPLLLYTDLAARTKRIKFGPLGLVLPAWDPLRAAEELAVLDQLTKGRVYAGFARGYQDRWVNVLGQQYHATGAPMDGSAIDKHNRKVYEDRKSTRLNSSHVEISYAVFCLKKKKKKKKKNNKIKKNRKSAKGK